MMFKDMELLGYPTDLKEKEKSGRREKRKEEREEKKTTTNKPYVNK